MKSHSDMTPAEREAKRAELTAHLADRPEAVESEDPGIFEPGAIVFVDGRFACMSHDIAAMWPVAEPLLCSLLDFLPLKHRLEHWRERIESGAMLLMVYFSTSGGTRVSAAGILSYEPAPDGQPIIFAPVMTFDAIALEDAAAIAECAAVAAGANVVCMMAPRKVVAPLPGYVVIDDGVWRLQGVRVRPMQ